MNSRLELCLLVLLGFVISIAAWRFYAIYRRRKRWRMLMTSHESLHVARRRIVATPPSDED